MTDVWAPQPGAAPLPRMVAAQTRLELRSTLRNGEQLLLTMIIPVILLITLTLAPVINLGEGRRVDVITPGILALAVMSTAFTSLAIATGFERRSGALRHLGTTPLPRWALVVAKALAVLAIEVLQWIVIGAVALLLGWQPSGSAAAALALLLAGTAAFSALGLALAGILRAEATLAVANGVYVLLLLGGGVVIPTSSLPAGWASVAALLPSGALADGLRTVLLAGQTLPVQAFVVLLVWAVLAAIVAARTFRWD